MACEKLLPDIGRVCAAGFDEPLGVVVQCDLEFKISDALGGEGNGGRTSTP